MVFLAFFTSDLKHMAATEFGAEIGADKRVVGIIVGCRNQICIPLRLNAVVGVFAQDFAKIDWHVGLSGV